MSEATLGKQPMSKTSITIKKMLWAGFCIKFSPIVKINGMHKVCV